MERNEVVRSSQSDDETFVHIGPRPKQKTDKRSQEREKVYRTRSYSRGRAVLKRRKELGAEPEDNDENTPARHRSNSEELVDTPLGLGPATTLVSQGRFNFEPAPGSMLELPAPARPDGYEVPSIGRPLPTTEKEPSPHTRPAEGMGDSTSSSINDAPDYELLNPRTSSQNETIRPEEDPRSSSGLTAGIQPLSFVPTSANPLEKLTMEITSMKANISRLEMTSIQQSGKIEWLEQTLRRIRDENESLQDTIEELDGVIEDLKSRLEAGESKVKNLSNLCTFRAGDLHQSLSAVQQQLRERAVEPEVGTRPDHLPEGPGGNPSAQLRAACTEGPVDPPSTAPPSPSSPVSHPATDGGSIVLVNSTPNATLISSTRTEPAPTVGSHTSTSTTSSKGRVSTIRKSIMRQVDAIRQIITLDAADDTTDLEKLKYLQTKTVPRVEKAIMELESSLQKFSSVCDELEFDEISSTVDVIIEEATAYMNRITKLYNENEGYAPGLTGLEKTLTEIKPFSSSSEATIYEFLDKFNAYCAGTRKAKAYKLYTNYLAVPIQAQVEAFKQDYDAMTAFLHRTYGKIEVISNNMLLELERRKKPADSDLQERSESLQAIVNVILRVQNLRDHLPVEIVTAEVTGYAFLHRIRNLLCTTDYLELSKDLVLNDLDARVASGAKALEVTLARFRNTIAVLDPIVEKLKTKSKPRSAHIVDSHDADYTSPPPQNPPNYDAVYWIDSRLKSSGRWWNRSFKFPCPLAGHDHDLTDCDEFFSLTNKDRIVRCEGKICKTCCLAGGDCLQDKICKTPVPRRFVCPGCAEYARTKKLSPHNILFCGSKNPAHRTLHRNEIPAALEEYFGKPVVKKSSGPNRAGAYTCKNKAPKRKGKRISESRATSVQDMDENETVYLTQWIKIKDTPVLVMYDRGSNTNLIQGKLAKKLNLEVVSKRRGVVKVAGGDELVVKYGTFRVDLGASTSGVEKVLLCQGVDSITGVLEKQSLTTVNEELRKFGVAGSKPVLPKHAAGGEVGILIGIQDVQLDPFLLGVLPKGTGVYRCPLYDQWGSEISYAGPHPTFKATPGPRTRSSMFTKKKRNSEPGDNKGNHRHRRSYRNPRLCPLAPPGWGEKTSRRTETQTKTTI